MVPPLEHNAWIPVGHFPGGIFFKFLKVIKVGKENKVNPLFSRFIPAVKATVKWSLSQPVVFTFTILTSRLSNVEERGISNNMAFRQCLPCLRIHLYASCHSENLHWALLHFQGCFGQHSCHVGSSKHSEYTSYKNKLLMLWNLDLYQEDC